MDEEIRKVKAAVWAAVHREAVHIEHQPAATLEDLLDGLTRVVPHVVSFSGHAGEDLLEFDTGADTRGPGHRLSAGVFARAMGAVDVPPRLIVLNACKSQAQLDELVRVVPMAVGMRGSIGDPAAIAFAARFYASLTDGQSVRGAFQLAKVQLAGIPRTLPDADLPVLEHTPDIDPADAVLVRPGPADQAPQLQTDAQPSRLSDRSSHPHLRPSRRRLWLGLGAAPVIAAAITVVMALQGNPGSPTSKNSPRPQGVPYSSGPQALASQPTGRLLPSGSTVGSQTGPPPPFRWSVRINEKTCDGATAYHLVPPALRNQVKPLNNGLGLTQPVFKNAPDVVYTYVILTLQGKSSVATVLQGMHVHVAARAKPAGAVYENGELQCGGPLASHFSVNLDHANPQVVSTQGGDSSMPSLPYTISSTDPKVFYILAGTDRWDCQWFIDLDWSSQGQSGTIPITDGHGHPFHTVGASGLPVYSEENFKDWQLTTTPPRNLVTGLGIHS